MQCVRPAKWGLLALACGVAVAQAVPPAPESIFKSQTSPDVQAALALGLDRPRPRGLRPPARLLVLLVDFSDRPHAGNSTVAAFEERIFAAAGPSVRGYYATSSQGRFVLQGATVGWLRLPQPYAYYVGTNGLGSGVRSAYPRNAQRMVEDALAAADPQVDFRAFDNDGADGVPASGDDDGVVDALLVVHAGDGAETQGGREILSHNWTTVTAFRSAERIQAWSYATCAETSPLGVMAHEFGHQLGLADLYDRTSTTRLGGGLGDWTLMASGAWLDGGRTPADLDAPSKIDLGFVDPVVPRDNGRCNARSTVAGRAGDVFCVWTNGEPGDEFFVVENRQPRGLDAFLPGGGLMIYHVDRRRPDQDDAERPRVQLLQGDGRTDIENRINNGDGADPYPSMRTEVGVTTQPGSRARDGSDTQIRIYDLSAPTGSIDFALQVEATPRLLVDTIQPQGPAPQPGALCTWRVAVHNDGAAAMAALQVEVDARPATDVVWTSAAAVLPALGAGETQEFTIEGTPSSNLRLPYGLALRFSFTGGAWNATREVFTLVGASAGFQACFEPQRSGATGGCSDPSRPWDVVAAGGAGTWSTAVRAGEFGLVYRSAQGPRYANDADAGLESPPFAFASGSELRLLHAYATEDLAAGYCADGGRVELSRGNGPWVPLVPHGGYPRRFSPQSVAQLAGEGAFGGSSARRWDRFDLGPGAELARLRFRFASGDSLGGAGWEIARVEVGAPDATVEPQLQLHIEPNPVRGRSRIAFRIIAPLTWNARPTTLAVYDARGRLVRSLAHSAVPAQSGFVEWDGTDRAGRRVAAGVYLIRLDWGGLHAAKRLIVVR